MSKQQALYEMYLNQYQRGNLDPLAMENLEMDWRKLIKYRLELRKFGEFEKVKGNATHPVQAQDQHLIDLQSAYQKDEDLAIHLIRNYRPVENGSILRENAIQFNHLIALGARVSVIDLQFDYETLLKRSLQSKDLKVSIQCERQLMMIHLCYQTKVVDKNDITFVIELANQVGLQREVSLLKLLLCFMLVKEAGKPTQEVKMILNQIPSDTSIDVIKSSFLTGSPPKEWPWKNLFNQIGWSKLSIGDIILNRLTSGPTDVFELIEICYENPQSDLPSFIQRIENQISLLRNKRGLKIVCSQGVYSLI